jgi:hypothetical protein
MNKGIQGPIRRKQDMSIALQMGVPRAWLLANPTGTIYQSWGIRSVVAGGSGVLLINLETRRGISTVETMTMLAGPVTTSGMATPYYISPTQIGVQRLDAASAVSNGDFFLVIYGS